MCCETRSAKNIRQKSSNPTSPLLPLNEYINIVLPLVIIRGILGKYHSLKNKCFLRHRKGDRLWLLLEKGKLSSPVFTLVKNLVNFKEIRVIEYYSEPNNALMNTLLRANFRRFTSCYIVINFSTHLLNMYCFK